MNYEEFRKRTTKAHTKKKAKINNSYTIYDIYKAIRKTKWQGIGRPVTEKEFYAIIRTVNEVLVDDFLHGASIEFPYKLGKVELGKYSPVVRMEGDRVKTTYPINWKSTLKLWYEDEEARASKTLIRTNQPRMYKIVYNKRDAVFNNKNFFKFTPGRNFKKKVSEAITNNNLDAYIL